MVVILDRDSIVCSSLGVKILEIIIILYYEYQGCRGGGRASERKFQATISLHSY